MLKVAALTLLFCVFSSVSVVLTGNRSLISGDIFQNLFKIIFDWRFILAFVLSIGARFVFILINNALLAFPTLEKSSTSITLFITAIGYFFTVVLNIIFLGESLSIRQAGGALLMVIGVMLLMS